MCAFVCVMCARIFSVYVMYLKFLGQLIFLYLQKIILKTLRAVPQCCALAKPTKLDEVHKSSNQKKMCMGVSVFVCLCVCMCVHVSLCLILLMYMYVCTWVCLIAFLITDDSPEFKDSRQPSKAAAERSTHSQQLQNGVCVCVCVCVSVCKAWFTIFCLHRVVTRSAYKLIWTRVATQHRNRIFFLFLLCSMRLH